MGDTSIQWTDKTWNPVRGCSLVSPGCTNCYAMRQAHRFSAVGAPYEGLTRLTKNGPVWTGRARLVPEMLEAPLGWKRPVRVFVNSMSDLFHEDLTNEEIAAVFGIMGAAERHTFQVLTKRAKRMREWFEWLFVRSKEVRRRYPNQEVAGCYGEALINEGLKVKGIHGVPNEYPTARPMPNVWLGVSVEDQRRADERIVDLLGTPAAVRFLSVEPQLGPVDVAGYLHGIQWVIVGGESGSRARPFRVEWARRLRDQCRTAGVPFFCKQLGLLPVFTDDDRDINVVEGYEMSLDALGQEHLIPSDEQLASGAVIPLRDRHGGNMAEWPADLRIREFPEVRP